MKARPVPPPWQRGKVWPDAVVARAKQLRRDEGYGEVRISKILFKEFKPAPSTDTVRCWIRDRTRREVA